MTCRGIGTHCALFALALILTTTTVAAPPVTTIDDTLYKADGTPFRGVLIFNWKSFEGPGVTNIPTNNLTTQIVDGRLYVKLVPTTSASTAAYYSVRYIADGTVQFTEIWSVPPSDAALRVRDVRIAWPPSTTAIIAPVTEVTIANVEGLNEVLEMRPVKGTTYNILRTAVIGPTGALEGAAGTSTNCVRVDGSSGPCGNILPSSAGFIDGEIPAGSVNGTNSSFALAGTPNPAISLRVFRNGLLQKSVTDYSVSGNTIQFTTASIPVSGDVLQASYRIDPALTTAYGLVDAQTPSGLINGVNTTFTLTGAPSPAGSLLLYRNGVLQKLGIDYTLNSNTVSFLTASIPQTGDILLCSYRVATI